MKTILSIDGGGIRGIIPALILAELEKRTGQPVSAMFDLIAGTSTGGIIAVCLSKNNGSGAPAFSARELVKLYRDRGKEIFSRSLWKGCSSVGGALDEKYSEHGLENVLEEFLGNEPLGAALTHLLVTSYDIEKREPVFLKSWRSEWKPVEMRLAARATSAAPTYFEPALVPVGGTTRPLIDGGVFVNNPAMSAYAEARRIFPSDRDLFVVSLGTGELIRPIKYSEAKDWGLAGWMLPALSCMFDGVSDAVNYQMEQLLGSNYIRLQTDLALASDDMDNATSGNIANLVSEGQKLMRTNGQEMEKVVNMLLHRGELRAQERAAAG